MKIKADIDTKSLQAKLIEIHQDTEASGKYKKLENDYKNLEKKIRDIQEGLSRNMDWEATEKARFERETAFSSLSALEQVKQDIQRKTNTAVQNIEIGMTREEVIKLVGPPRASSFSHLNHGNVWLIIENNIVRLIVDARCFVVYFHARNYFETLTPCVGRSDKGIIKY